MLASCVHVRTHVAMIARSARCFVSIKDRIGCFVHTQTAFVINTNLVQDVLAAKSSHIAALEASLKRAGLSLPDIKADASSLSADKVCGCSTSLPQQIPLLFRFNKCVRACHAFCARAQICGPVMHRAEADFA